MLFKNNNKSTTNKIPNRCCRARSSSFCNEVAISKGISVSIVSIVDGSMNRVLRRLISSVETSLNDGIISG